VYTDSYGNTRFPGLYRGIVAAVGDPLNKGRVKLQIPQILGEAITDWAWGSYAAGIETADLEVGMGVWVQFEGGDPSYPIWNDKFNSSGSVDYVQLNPSYTNSSPPEGMLTWQTLANVTAANGTVTSVTAGTGIAASTGASPITTSGTLSLAAISPTAPTGTYGSATQIPTITVDQYGRTTAVVNTPISSVPVGAVQMYAGTGATTSTDSTPGYGINGIGANAASTVYPWLLCNGNVVSRTVYASLFLAIGESYGAGDGMTTFALPNMTNRFPRGATAPIINGGSDYHTHVLNADGYAKVRRGNNRVLIEEVTADSWTGNQEVSGTGSTSTTGGATAAGLGGITGVGDNIPSYAGFRFIIKT
jgi:microcystin-dependent protein